MKLNTKKLTIIAAAAGLVSMTMLHAEGPATQPAPMDAAALRSDIDLKYGDLQDLLDSPENLTDPVKRAAAAPQAVGGLKKIVADMDQLVAIDADHKDEIIVRRTEYVMLLSLFGDTTATDRLESESGSDDPQVSLEAKRSQLMVKWIAASQDAAGQAEILRSLEELAKENPKSEGLAFQLFGMTRLGPASPDMSKQALALLTGTMKGDFVDSIKQQAEAGAKLASLENKPLTIIGKQPDGKDFTTADLKGKVVLVDFWATWCGPCVAEIPHVKDMYTKYHDKGLEVVGVDNDYTAAAVKNFAIAKDLPWPQLFNADAAAKQQWNPLTLGYGINGIPTMFLIDKKGVCRTVIARENMDDLIPKLLAE